MGSNLFVQASQQGGQLFRQVLGDQAGTKIGSGRTV
jgi:hypothetical protein